MPDQEFLSGGHPAFRVRDKETQHKYTVGVIDPEVHEKLNERATDGAGRPLPAEHHIPADQQIKGAELDAALDDAGLSKSGSADEKRQRLADHQNGVQA